MIREIIHRLSEVAESGPDGICSPDIRKRMTQRLREQFPEGYYNLGIAHGSPAVVALLGRIWETGIERDAMEATLFGAWNWLLEQRLDPNPTNEFPAWLYPKDPPPLPSQRWCYGNPAIAAALLVAARCTRNASWEANTVAMAIRSAESRDSAKAKMDACLCHGSAGLALIYNRLYHETSEETFADAARHWLKLSLSMQRPGHGHAGYQFITSEPGGAALWCTRPGLIDGAAGTALALLAAATDVEPEWDRIMMISSSSIPAHKRIRMPRD